MYKIDSDFNIQKLRPGLSARDIINNKGYCKSCGHYGLIDRNSSQKIIT